MSEYKDEVYNYLTKNPITGITVGVDADDEIMIRISANDRDFKVYSEQICDALVLNKPYFKSNAERLPMLITNGENRRKIILNPDRDDLDTDAFKIE